MAAINDLIAQIQDPALRAKIEQEVSKLSKQKKFGLVFEEHLPECTPLYDVKIRKGTKVSLKQGKVNEFYTVLKIDGEKAICKPRDNDETVELTLNDLVAIAEFGEPIYPYLKPIDSVCNAPDSDLWHTLIEADNYHALQLLEYLYAGKVDCIYIDPPYNTGARDWKYNNDYVDGADTYRHSKWLSFMQKRLKLAKKLLNPKDSVLIVTIDEKEYLHLGCLLEEIFPESNIQMISSVINRHGSMRFSEFTRVNEYIFYVRIGDACIGKKPATEEEQPIHWHSLKRSGTSKGNYRSGRPMLFYPIYIEEATNKVFKIGEPLPIDQDIESVETIDGCITVLPIRKDKAEGCWSLSPEKARELLAKGYFRVGKYNAKADQKYELTYLQSGTVAAIENGEVMIKGYNPDGSVIASYVVGKNTMEVNQWDYSSHDASEHGTKLLSTILGNRFSYPKSLYAVKDCILYTGLEKKDSLIIDFFAGSGTTLHAVNLLNAEDGGNRRCIIVTNNEVSVDEAKSLDNQGYKPGDEEWEKLGIARYVTWPRTVCSIEGHDINGVSLKGSYLGSDIPMADGFKSNTNYFKLGFLDKTSIALGRQFKEMLPTLWMKAGAIGPCPEIDDNGIGFLILPQNKFAVLCDESRFTEFEQQIRNLPEIKTVYLVTDYEAGYRTMIKNLPENIENTYQLYRDYLDNFRINTGRS